MKYFHLIWAALFRRKTRTFLTLASILAAFLLFGMLDGIRSTFASLGQNADGAQRLQTASRLSFMDSLPQSLEARLRKVDNIEDVTHANWFGRNKQATPTRNWASPGSGRRAISLISGMSNETL